MPRAIWPWQSSLGLSKRLCGIQISLYQQSHIYSCLSKETYIIIFINKLIIRKTKQSYYFSRHSFKNLPIRHLPDSTVLKCRVEEQCFPESMYISSVQRNQSCFYFTISRAKNARDRNMRTQIHALYGCCISVNKPCKAITSGERKKKHKPNKTTPPISHC